MKRAESGERRDEPDGALCRLMREVSSVELMNSGRSFGLKDRP